MGGEAASFFDQVKLLQKELADLKVIVARIMDKYSPLGAMLKATPVEDNWFRSGASEAALKTWKMNGLMTLERIHARRGAFETVMSYDEKLIFRDYWKDMNGFLYTGTVHKDTQKKHGFIRVIGTDGSIWEGQFKNGKMHGFFRDIGGDGTFLTGYNRSNKPCGVWRQYDAENHIVKHYRIGDNGKEELLE